MPQFSQICLLLLASMFLISCSQESKNKNIKKMANMMESNFQGKEETRKKLEELGKQYIETLNNDSLGFEKRYDLLAAKYFQRFQGFINHALISKKRTIVALSAADQMQIFNLRKSFDANDLQELSIRELLEQISKEGIFFGMSDATMINLLFYDKNTASAAIKSTFSVAPILFHNENGTWKIDPLGDPLHQKMKEQKLASMQKKSYEEYKKSIAELLDVKEEDWIPLKDR